MNIQQLTLFSNQFNDVYYETEIDLRQIDPTIQSIGKFQDAYKTIEISNLGNLQVECGPCAIEYFISNRNVDLLEGQKCDHNIGSLNNITLQKDGRKQVDKINFDNIRILYTKNITNEVQTFEPIAYTDGLPSYDDYKNIYKINNKEAYIIFLLQITKLSNKDKDKIKEAYLQAYYTNDLKLKIRFTKKILVVLSGKDLEPSKWTYLGNDKDITIDVDNPNVLGIRNKSDSPVKITIKPS